MESTSRSAAPPPATEPMDEGDTGEREGKRQEYFNAALLI